MRKTLPFKFMLVCVMACFALGLELFGEDASTSAQETAKTTASETASAEKPKLEKIVKSDKEWRKQLSRNQYNVTRRGATERARTGRYWNHKAKGTYLCVCCDLPLFASKTKFKSGTGWPSFYAPVDKEHVGKKVDRSLFTTRIEVHCNRCAAHLGHVFSDGPRPTGLRYCINSASLKFESVDAAKRKADKEKSGRSSDGEKAVSKETK